MPNVEIEKLVHGGQGLGTLPDGRKVFVWNALPGELVGVELKKTKRGHAEGVATVIHEPSLERVVPRDKAYLSTSPWQIMTYEAENKYKQEILNETLEREHVTYSKRINFSAPKNPWQYRNKMEYSFYGDDQGLHLALFNRGTHAKQIVEGSSIAMQKIDAVAAKILKILNTNGVRASQLKTLVLRADQKGNVAAALFVKDESFPEIVELGDTCTGFVVYFSNPKSPASIRSRELFTYGTLHLQDKILAKIITYDINSFFQVNLEIFETALTKIKEQVAEEANIIDMYAGVGAIGLSVGAGTLVEMEPSNVAMAKKNVLAQNTRVIQAATEAALEYITAESCVIFDPPRAGLHKKVIDRLLEVRPKKIIYLSCNPITHARDLQLLQDNYAIKSVDGYNFFPRTPHIESLAMLEGKQQ